MTSAERQPKAAADAAAEADADAGAGEQHDLLDRERLAALLRRVVVAEQAGGRRLGDRLAEAERRPHADEHREARPTRRRRR